jgi:GT2 family glycosyltransferase
VSAVRLSVVVLAWNERDDLAGCLDALAAADVPGGLEVVVVDNGSTDGTPALLDATPWVRVVRNERNVGVAPGRNAGLAVAGGRDVGFLDSDTVVGPQTLRRLLDALDEDPGLGMVGPRLEYPDGTLQLSCRRVPGAAAVVANRAASVLGGRLARPARRYLMADAPHDRRMDVDYLLGAAMLLRGRAIREVGGFDPGSTPGGFGFDDLDVALSLWARGWRVAYVPDAVARHGYRRRLAERPMSAGTAHLARSLARVRRAHAGVRPAVTRPPRSGPTSS